MLFTKVKAIAQAAVLFSQGGVFFERCLSRMSYFFPPFREDSRKELFYFTLLSMS